MNMPAVIGEEKKGGEAVVTTAKIAYGYLFSIDILPINCIALYIPRNSDLQVQFLHSFTMNILQPHCASIPAIFEAMKRLCRF